MTTDLTTTNVFLGILAAMSLLEGIAVGAILLGAFLVYRHIGRLITNIETRQVAPAVTRVNAILDDVKGVTSMVRQKSARVDAVVEEIVDRLGHTRHRAGGQPHGKVM